MFSKKLFYSNSIKKILFVICVTFSLFPSNKLLAEDGKYLTSDQHAVLDQMFKAHANYFLSDKVMAKFGIPIGAYKVGNRARFGYSNPTEWGYAWETWLAAAERGMVTQEAAVSMITKGLTTFSEIQQNPDQSYEGHPYPYYRITDGDGLDLDVPFYDGDPRVPSGDNALLYASILVVEGWAIHRNHTALANLAHTIRERMDWKVFMVWRDGRYLIAHQYSPDIETLSEAAWDVYADEGGMVAWVAYESGSITFDEFKDVTTYQLRSAHKWTDAENVEHTVEEAAWFNMAFTWTIRSTSGFPVGNFDSPTGTSSTYSQGSLVPNWIARKAYARDFGIDHPAFSVAMTQTDEGKALVGWHQNWYIPPNLASKVGDLPHHSTPHSLFVPLNALPDFTVEQRATMINDIVKLRDDTRGYFFEDGEFPFGFEVTASVHYNDNTYDGTDDGRQIFESLSNGYSTLSLFTGLQLDEGAMIFSDFAMCAPGVREKTRNVISYLYPKDLSIPDTQTAIEDTSYDISGIEFADPTTANPVSLTLILDHGTCSVAASSAVINTSTVDDGTKVIISGSAADVRTAIATVTIKGSSNFSGTANLAIDIEYQENDGEGNLRKDNTNLPIVITPVNDAPVISEGTAVSVTMDEDSSPTPFALALNVIEVDNDDIIWSIVSVPSCGEASVVDGVVTYNPLKNFNGADTFSVKADDSLLSDSIVVSVTVNSINDIPTTKNLQLLISKSNPWVGQIPADDEDGEPLSYSITEQPSKGTLSVPDSFGNITYTPDEAGKVSFTYQVSDGKADATGTIEITIVGDDVNLTQAAGGYCFSLPVLGQAQTLASLGYPSDFTAKYYSPLTKDYVTTKFLLPGYAYWIKPTESITPVFYGQSATTTITLTCKKGWNLLGTPSLKDIPWDQDSIFVTYLGERKSLREAYAANWCDNYAWYWDVDKYKIIADSLILPSAKTEITSTKGFWFRTLVDECFLEMSVPFGDVSFIYRGAK